MCACVCGVCVGGGGVACRCLEHPAGPSCLVSCSPSSALSVPVPKLPSDNSHINSVGVLTGLKYHQLFSELLLLLSAAGAPHDSLRGPTEFIGCPNVPVQ